MENGRSFHSPFDNYGRYYGFNLFYECAYANAPGVSGDIGCFCGNDHFVLAAGIFVYPDVQKQDYGNAGLCRSLYLYPERDAAALRAGVCVLWPAAFAGRWQISGV